MERAKKDSEEEEAACESDAFLAGGFMRIRLARLLKLPAKREKGKADNNSTARAKLLRARMRASAY